MCGTLVVVSEKSSGTGRDHSPLVVLSGERLHRGNIGELSDGHELDLLLPVEVRVSHDDTQKSYGMVVGSKDLVASSVGDVLIVSLGQALQPLRITKLDGDDMLQELADRTRIDSLSRFVDGLIVAIERGTPLADVLRAQAVDVREAGRRQLLEAGGRKEIAMMIPVVFLVLPTTVIFAFYPALVSFTFFAQ